MSDEAWSQAREHQSQVEFSADQEEQECKSQTLESQPPTYEPAPETANTRHQGEEDWYEDDQEVLEGHLQQMQPQVPPYDQSD